MAAARRSIRQERQEMADDLRARHYSWAQIAEVFRRRYHLNARAGLRVARGWSQRDAADQWNSRWPADPKTFKNFSYWEQWPAPTGHAPSLEVLTRLAELYECRVADLVGDCADFRSRDREHRESRTLATMTPTADDAQLSDMLDRLDSADVHEVARLAARWAQNIRSAMDRRSLLLKLSAGLSLAAASPALAEDTGTAPPTSAVDGDFAGIWLSRYHYTSTGRRSDFIGEHYVVIRQQGTRLLVHSVPADNGSVLNLDLTVTGSVATGTWSERTAPDGYYRGAVYHGAIQLIIDPMGKTMTGRWLGFDRESTVNSDTWELRWVEKANSRNTIRGYHGKA